MEPIRSAPESRECLNLGPYLLVKHCFESNFSKPLKGVNVCFHILPTQSGPAAFGQDRTSVVLVFRSALGCKSGTCSEPSTLVPKAKFQCYLCAGCRRISLEECGLDQAVDDLAPRPQGEKVRRAARAQGPLRSARVAHPGHNKCLVPGPVHLRQYPDAALHGGSVVHPEHCGKGGRRRKGSPEEPARYAPERSARKPAKAGPPSAVVSRLCPDVALRGSERASKEGKSDKSGKTDGARGAFGAPHKQS